MKRLALLLAVLILTSCDTPYKNVRIVDATIDSISPDGFRGLGANFRVTADNPGKSFVVSNVTVVARYNESRCLVFTCDKVTVDGKCQKTYNIPVYGTLDPDFSLLSFLAILTDLNIDDFVLDINGTVTSGKQKQRIKMKNVPAKKLLKRL